MINHVVRKKTMLGLAIQVFLSVVVVLGWLIGTRWGLIVLHWIWH